MSATPHARTAGGRHYRSALRLFVAGGFLSLIGALMILRARSVRLPPLCSARYSVTVKAHQGDQAETTFPSSARTRNW